MVVIVSRESAFCIKCIHFNVMKNVGVLTEYFHCTTSQRGREMVRSKFEQYRSVKHQL